MKKIEIHTFLTEHGWLCKKYAEQYAYKDGKKTINITINEPSSTLWYCTNLTLPFFGSNGNRFIANPEFFKNTIRGLERNFNRIMQQSKKTTKKCTY